MLKTYTLGVNAFPPFAVLAALGERRHIRQASVTVVAASKVASRRRSEPLGDDPANAGLRRSAHAEGLET